jgi:hypothetical protein
MCAFRVASAEGNLFISMVSNRLVSLSGFVIGCYIRRFGSIIQGCNRLECALASTEDVAPEVLLDTRIAHLAPTFGSWVQCSSQFKYFGGMSAVVASGVPVAFFISISAIAITCRIV